MSNDIFKFVQINMKHLLYIIVTYVVVYEIGLFFFNFSANASSHGNNLMRQTRSDLITCFRCYAKGDVTLRETFLC